MPQTCLRWAGFDAEYFLSRVRTPTKSQAPPLNVTQQIHVRFSIRAYRGLCGLFVVAGCHHSSHYGQQ